MEVPPPQKAPVALFVVANCFLQTILLTIQSVHLFCSKFPVMRAVTLQEQTLEEALSVCPSVFSVQMSIAFLFFLCWHWSGGAWQGIPSPLWKTRWRGRWLFAFSWLLEAYRISKQSPSSNFTIACCRLRSMPCRTVSMRTNPLPSHVGACHVLVTTPLLFTLCVAMDSTDMRNLQTPCRHQNFLLIPFGRTLRWWGLSKNCRPRLESRFGWNSL